MTKTQKRGRKITANHYDIRNGDNSGEGSGGQINYIEDFEMPRRGVNSKDKARADGNDGVLWANGHNFDEIAKGSKKYKGAT